jgi:hypothetical protein
MQNTETGGLTRGERSVERDDQIESRHSLSNDTELVESYPISYKYKYKYVRTFGQAVRRGWTKH